LTGKWRRLHNKELYALYSSPNFILEIKSRRLRWAGNVARGTGEVCTVLVVKPEGEHHLENLGVDGSVILKLIFEKWGGGMDWNDLAQNRDRWRAVVNAVMNLRAP
jgi:hypothetical protein